MKRTIIDEIDTGFWRVSTARGFPMGYIKFCNHWNQFVFYPVAGIQLDISVMEEICELLKLAKDL